MYSYYHNAHTFHCHLVHGLQPIISMHGVADLYTLPPGLMQDMFACINLTCVSKVQFVMAY